MIGFDYKYNPVEKVINDVKVLHDFNFIEQIIFFSSIIGIIFLIQYLLPFIFFIHKYRIEEKEKNKKRLLLKQIVLQKDIESEIEKEIEEDEKAIERGDYN